MTTDDRHRAVAARFGAAAGHYDQHAPLQRQVADRLAARMPARLGRVLEIGCGTGLLSAHLHPRADWLVASDLAPAMVRQCRHRLGPAMPGLCLDGGAPLPLAPASVDTVASALTAQWFTDPMAAVAGWRRVLRPGGGLWCATLGDATFREWRAAHARLGLPCGTPVWPGAEGWRAAGFQVTETHLTETHATARAFLTRLRGTGAHLPAPGHRPLSAAALRRVCRVLEGDGPAILTWHILFVHSPAP